MTSPTWFVPWRPEPAFASQSVRQGKTTSPVPEHADSLQMNYLEELHCGKIARVERIFCREPLHSADGGWSDRFHFVVPEAGSFVYQKGRSAAFLDENGAIFVDAEREYQVRHPIEGDFSFAIFPADGSPMNWRGCSIIAATQGDGCERLRANSAFVVFSHASRTSRANWRSMKR